MTIREQTEIENDWIAERVEKDEIPKEAAKKLELQALYEKLDTLSMSHLKKFIKLSNEEAIALKAELQEERKMLGTDPSEIGLQDLKNYIKDKIAGQRGYAEERTNQKINETWKREVAKGSALSFDDGCAPIFKHTGCPAREKTSASNHQISTAGFCSNSSTHLPPHHSWDHWTAWICRGTHQSEDQ